MVKDRTVFMPEKDPSISFEMERIQVHSSHLSRTLIYVFVCEMEEMLVRT
jgi:hypothetical protein